MMSIVKVKKKNNYYELKHRTKKDNDTSFY